MMRVRVDGLIDDSPPDWTGVYVAKRSESVRRIAAIEALVCRDVGRKTQQLIDGELPAGWRRRPNRWPARRALA